MATPSRRLAGLALVVLASASNTGCRQRGDCDARRLEAGVRRVAKANDIEKPSVAAYAIVDACGAPPTDLLRDHLTRKAKPLDKTLSRAEFDDPIHDQLWREVCPNGPNYEDLFRPETAIGNSERHTVCGHDELGVLSADEAAVAGVGPNSWLIFAWMRKEGADLKAARALTRALMLPGALVRHLETSEGQNLPKVASATAPPSSLELRVDGLEIYVDGVFVRPHPNENWRRRWRMSVSDYPLDRQFLREEGQPIRLVADASMTGEALVELLRLASDWGLGPVYVMVETPEPYRPFASVPMRRAQADESSAAVRLEPEETLGELTARAAEAMGQPCCVEREGPGCAARCSVPEALVTYEDLEEPTSRVWDRVGE